MTQLSHASTKTPQQNRASELELSRMLTKSGPECLTAPPKLFIKRLLSRKNG